MSVALVTALLLSGPIGGGLYAPRPTHGGCQSCETYGAPASLYEGRHGHHNPARTCGMVRYTHRMGVLYSRPYDYRTLFDYPWHWRKAPCSECTGGPGMAGEEIVSEEAWPIESAESTGTVPSEPTAPHSAPAPLAEEPTPAAEKAIPSKPRPAPAAADETPLPFDDDKAPSPFDDDKATPSSPPAKDAGAGKQGAHSLEAAERGALSSRLRRSTALPRATLPNAGAR